MSAEQLYDNLAKYLVVSSKVTKPEGRLINENENFTVRFQVINTSLPSDEADRSTIIFNNVKVDVGGTGFAEPIKGDGPYKLNVNSLGPSQYGYVDLVFKAKMAFPTFISTHEPIARVEAMGDLDLSTFFRIKKYKLMQADIKPT